MIMGGYAGAHQFCRVGAHAFIGNNTSVLQDIPPYVLATGHPAEPRSVNIEGIKRRGFSDVEQRAIRNAYRVLYRSELKLEDALAQLREMAREQAVLGPMVDFIAQPGRGLARGSARGKPGAPGLWWHRDRGMPPRSARPAS